MERVDEADRAALVAHDDGHGAGAAAKVLDASHHGRIGNGRRREDAVVAFDQVVEGHDAVDVINAHFPAALPFFVGIGNEAGLHIAAQAFQGRRSQDAFRSAADAHEDVDAGPFDTGVDSRRDVTVRDELDTGAGTAAFVDDFLMARPVEDDDGQIVDAPFQAFGDAAQVFLNGLGQVDAAFGPRADTELFHVHVRSVEQVPLAGDGHDGNGPILAFRRQVRPFQRVDGDIDFRAAGADFFTDIEHRRFVHFAFADDDSPINRNRR